MSKFTERLEQKGYEVIRTTDVRVEIHSNDPDREVTEQDVIGWIRTGLGLHTEGTGRSGGMQGVEYTVALIQPAEKPPEE